MTEQESTQQEPTMEEILASIRRIISEDGDEGEPKAAAPASDAVTEDQPAMEEEPETSAEVLELTQVVNDDGSVSDLEDEPPHEDLEMDLEADSDSDFDNEADFEPELQSEQTPMSEPKSAPQPHEEAASAAHARAGEENDLVLVEQDAEEVDETLLSPEAMDAAVAAFGPLSQNLVVTDAEAPQTLEGIVRQMMRPMLKDWMEENLPTIIEEVVEREVRRAATKRRTRR